MANEYVGEHPTAAASKRDSEQGARHGRRCGRESRRALGREKCILSKRYFDELVANVESLAETLEIMADRRLFNQVMAASETIGDDLRRGKLHSFEEAFEEE